MDQKRLHFTCSLKVLPEAQCDYEEVFDAASGDGLGSSFRTFFVRFNAWLLSFGETALNEDNEWQQKVKHVMKE